MGERLEILLPDEMVERMDRVVELLGFGSREEFVMMAIRQILDRNTVLARKLR